MSVTGVEACARLSVPALFTSEFDCVSVTFSVTEEGGLFEEGSHPVP